MELADLSKLLPFDQYQRYSFLCRAVQLLSGKDDKVILEVGGAYSPLPRLMPEHTVLLLDRIHAPNLSLRANGLQLPFPNGAFETVVSTDVLEHLPIEDRSTFLKELARVANKLLIIGFPHNHPLTIHADRTLFEFVQRETGIEYSFIKEHLAYGLPSVNDVKETIRPFTESIFEFQNANLRSWLFLMMTDFLMQKDARLNQSRMQFHDAFNRFYDSSSHRPPCYRTFLVCFKHAAEHQMRENIDKLQIESEHRDADDYAIGSLALALSFHQALATTKVELQHKDFESQSLRETLLQQLQEKKDLLKRIGTLEKSVDRLTLQNEKFQQMSREQQDTEAQHSSLFLQRLSRLNLLEAELYEKEQLIENLQREKSGEKET